MATLTYDPTPADQPEFNEQEQEALAIGEQAAADQQQMLAGKFKDAEALEQAYIELQKKLGEPNEDAEEGVRDEAPTEEVEEPSVDVTLTNASKEFEENGKLSEDTIAELSKLDSSELIEAYMRAQTQQQTADLSDAQVDDIQKTVGGEESYQNIMKWASQSLPDDMVQAYDSLVESGNAQSIKLALAGIEAAYKDSNGYEGAMLTGKAAQQQADVFRSQAEVVQAMADPRYDRDPAYRNDVFQKLSRSDIQY